MKPGDLQLGLIEFLTILVPGAAVTWLAWKLTGLNLRLAGLVPANEIARWAAFAIVALLVGQILERLGALICDAIYDWHRGLTAPGGTGPAFPAMRALRDETLRLGVARKGHVAQPEQDRAWAAGMLASAAAPGRGSATAPLLAGREEPVNVSQFSCAILRARAPRAWIEVERTQALSKLFRTLTIGALSLFGSILVLSPTADQRAVAWATMPPLLLLGGALGSFVCYAVLRVEAIKRAHRYALLAVAIPEQPAKAAQAE